MGIAKVRRSSLLLKTPVWASGLCHLRPPPLTHTQQLEEQAGVCHLLGEVYSQTSLMENGAFGWPQLKCTGQTFPRTAGPWPSQVWEEEAGPGLPANKRQVAVGNWVPRAHKRNTLASGLPSPRKDHRQASTGLHFSLVSVFPTALPGGHLACEGLSFLLPFACRPSLHQTFLLPLPASFLPSILPSLQILSELNSEAKEKLGREAVGQGSPPEGTGGIWIPGSRGSEKATQLVEGLPSIPKPLGSNPGIV